MKRVRIIRGIPGCGKSTYVKMLLDRYEVSPDDTVVCSADNFFMVPSSTVVNLTPTYEYRFDPTKLAQAHTYCMSTFLDAVHSGVQLVIVDNTFVHHWELKNYLKVANYLEYETLVHEIRVQTLDQLKICIKKNVHGVPADVISRMALEFEPLETAVQIRFENSL